MITSFSRFAFAALFCCGMFSLHSNALAQCPDSTGPAPNPDSVAWIQDSAYVMIPGTSCWIWEYYCDRVILGTPNTVQGWLDGVLVDSNTDCDSIADSTLVFDAQLMLDSIVANNNWSVVSPCIKGQYTILQVYSPQCWAPYGGGPASHQILIAPCSAYGYYCEKQCQACLDPSTDKIVISNCVVITSAVDVECSRGPWIPGSGCYMASCDGWYYGESIEHSANVEVSASIDTSMQAYPNPASGSLIVTSSVAGEQIQLLDVLGREVMNGIIPANGPLALDVSSLSVGTYYVSGGRSEVKFVKK
jgi:hypothetical protein